MKVQKFISNYLKAANVTAPLTVTVTTTAEEEFKNPEKGTSKKSLVLFFKELEQGVVTCPTSIEQLVEIFGSDETDTWVGKKVVLYNDTNVLYMGKRVGGIRFKKAS